MWLVLILAGVFTTIVGILIGLPTLRLRGDYLAIVTLGFGEIVPQFVRNGDSVGGFDLTNGTFGIAPIDSLGVGGFVFRAQDNKDDLYYWTAVGLVLFTVFCCVRLRDSRLGRAWVAIREDETAAAAMGVPLMRTKTWSYAIGAFFGGVAGAFYASYKAGAFPADFYFNFSIFLLCMVILGGMGSIWGVIVGGLILGYLNIEGSSTIGSKIQDAGVDFDPTKYQFGIYGAIIVLDDAVPADRADSRTQAQDRDRGGRARHSLLRRADRGHADRPRLERRLMAAAVDNLLVAEQGAEGVRRPRRDRRCRLRHPARRHRGADRPERRRQDDVLQPDHRGLHADLRVDRVRRRRGRRQAAARDRRARRRPHVPEHPPVRADDRGRERARRHAQPPSRRHLRLDPAHAACQARRAGGASTRARSS